MRLLRLEMCPGFHFQQNGVTGTTFSLLTLNWNPRQSRRNYGFQDIGCRAIKDKEPWERRPMGRAWDWPARCPKGASWSTMSGRHAGRSPDRSSHLGLQPKVPSRTQGGTVRIRGSYPKASHSQDSSFILRGQPHGFLGHWVEHSEFFIGSGAKLTFHWALPCVSGWTKGIWRGHVAQRPSHLWFCGLSSTFKAVCAFPGATETNITVKKVAYSNRNCFSRNVEDQDSSVKVLSLDLGLLWSRMILSWAP